jgi:hypothetical protein
LPSTKTIKRSELYRLVWQEPMIQLAKSFAISDVGLAKICRKHDIPRPPRGYWAKCQWRVKWEPLSRDEGAEACTNGSRRMGTS